MKNKKSTSYPRQKPQKINHIHKPEGMSLEEWQRALRAQAALREDLTVRPVDRAAEGYFQVINPKSSRTYSVVFRGERSGWNYCSCPDFRTNRLGTCKHIEAVAKFSGGKYASKIYDIPDRTSVYLDYHGPRRVRIRIGGANREEMKSLAADFFDAGHVLDENMIESFDDFLTRARLIDPDFKIFDDALDYVIAKREMKRRDAIADENPDITHGLLKVQLYPYQKQGVEFAFRHGRVVIADEMGLGKTIQAIGAAMLFRQFGFAQTVWIICPTSLKYQWKKEIEKFTDEVPLVVEGNVSARVAALTSDKSFFKIISYHAMVNTIRHGIPVNPDMVIYDEVQRLKNWDTKMSKEMRQLHSDYVVALSGTPLENKLVDLYSVMQLVDQFVLGPYWQFVSETTDTDDTGRVVGYRNLNRVGETLRSVLIRRLKKDVRLQMPARTDKTLLVPVTKEQLAIHDDAKWNVSILLARWRNQGFLLEKDRRRLLQLLAIMRMAADSTFILDQKTRHDTKIDEAIEIIEDVIESGDEKIVIFSQWERMQRIMASELEARGIGFRFLHGGVPSQKRGTLIEDFMTSPDCRVFLSTDAGSTGLNLQRASIVINLDLPWNPAVLEQRIARVFRLGQERQVQVINMVSVNTIEQQMIGTLAFKTGLFEGVLDGGEDSIALNDKKFDRLASLVESTIDASSEAENKEEDFTEVPDGNSEEYEDDIYDDTIDWADDPVPSDSSAPSDPISSAGSPQSPQSHQSSQNAHNTQSSNSTQSAHGSENAENPALLISKGVEFLTGLAKTLATPESRQNLVDSLVKEDPATGKASISIPVADKSAVASLINAAASLLSSLAR